jgi:hypothetical protein
MSQSGSTSYHEDKTMTDFANRIAAAASAFALSLALIAGTVHTPVNTSAAPAAMQEMI